MPQPALLHPAPLAANAASLRSGQIALRDYISDLLDLLDTVEPHVQALVPEPDRRARLLADAETLPTIWPDPNTRPPLYGIPVGVKDIFHADGFFTRAGSKLPAEALTKAETDSVRLLREAGALVLGKTVTTEFAFFEPGPTRNPHNLAHTPGGSSSGSAAAVAAGIAPLALGTQTIGSVIRPAAFCGIVGFKPSYHRLNPEGIIFFSPAVDHVGLFTQDVAGMRLAASVLCRDWQPATHESRPVLGIPDGPYLAQASSEARTAFLTQTAALEAAGYKIVHVPIFKDIEQINARHRTLIAAEFAHEHAALFAEYESLYRPRTAALIREGQTITEEEAEDIRDGRQVLREEIEHVMDVHDIDLWICPPATGPAPQGLDSTGDPIMNLPWTYMGLPAVTVPAGRFGNGLPAGLQGVGRWMEDEQVLGWAQEIAAILSAS